MKKTAKDFVKHKALEFGITVGGLTPLDEIRGLLHKIRPMDTATGLTRYGPSNDGGYLMPDDLDAVAACISPGVSTESRFDLQIAERGIDVYMADASVDHPSISHPRFHFTKKFLGAYTEGDFISINDYGQTVSNPDGLDLIMQMDIEGAEYIVLPEMNDELLKSLRIIIIEMHHLDSMFLQFPFRLIQATFEKILRHHHVVHIHPNNCCGAATRKGIEIPRVMEFTFYRKDRGIFKQFEGRLPPRHALDEINILCHPELLLPDCWR